LINKGTTALGNLINKRLKRLVILQKWLCQQPKKKSKPKRKHKSKENYEILNGFFNRKRIPLNKRFQI
jgi:hypothetical protein